jgi:hemolysin D
MTMTQPQSPEQSTQGTEPATAKVIPLRPPTRWHDPLKLIQTQAPSDNGRIVLWVISALIVILIVWAAFGKLDIIVGAEGKLVPQTLIKVVQPAEAGVVRQLLVDEGDSVKAGQVLATLDTTLAHADSNGIATDLATQKMQVRRITAELADKAMPPQQGDDPALYAHVQSQYSARRRTYLDSLEQEKALLSKAEHERKSAIETRAKLEQTVPIYRAAAQSYADLAKEGYVPAQQGFDKQREAIEKQKDLDAQMSTVAAADAALAAQARRVSQLQSSYKSDLQKELAEIRAKIDQLKPTLDKTMYKEGQMELRAPQDGVIKDLATTTVGAVVQPGTVVLTLVPKGEQLYADVNIKNEDVGFVQINQTAQIKLSAYPFQKYGMLTGKVIHVSGDATESKPNPNQIANSDAIDPNSNAPVAMYKARIQLDKQTLTDPQGNQLTITPGMQIVAEINQGKRTVLEYLLSPVRKAASEAGRER